jgi:hypothetical protein
MWSSTLVLELGDIERPIGGAQKMGLRAAAHGTEVLHG